VFQDVEDKIGPRQRNKVLAEQNRDKLKSHLPVALNHFCTNYQTLSQRIENLEAIELWKTKCPPKPPGIIA
jgi:hypothetical protein